MMCFLTDVLWDLTTNFLLYTVDLEINNYLLSTFLIGLAYRLWGFQICWMDKVTYFLTMNRQKIFRFAVGQSVKEDKSPRLEDVSKVNWSQEKHVHPPVQKKTKQNHYKKNSQTSVHKKPSLSHTWYIKNTLYTYI